MMKKSALFVFTFLTVATLSSAQTTKGTFAVGADFPRFFSGIRNGMKLNAGAFVADNFLFGVNSGIRYRSIRNLAGQRFNGPAVDLGFFARYYVPDGGNDLRIFVHAEGGIDQTWASGLDERYEFAGLGSGLAFFIQPELAVELQSKIQVNNQGGELNWNWTRWGIGIKYFLGTKAPRM